MIHQEKWNVSNITGINNTAFEISSRGRIRDIFGERGPDYISSNGRYYTFIPTVNQRSILYPTDMLVASAHILVPEELLGKHMIVKHKNDILTDINADNLEWVEDIEEWKDIDFWGVNPGRYQISNHGRIKSLLNDIILKVAQNRKYPRISISTGNNGDKNFVVHRLVAKAFVPGYSESAQIVNHIDGNTHNFHYLNLEWVSDSENKEHAARTGLIPRGDESPVSKISEKEAKAVCEALNKYKGNIIKAFKYLKPSIPTLTYPIVSMIKYRECFKYISDEILTEDGSTKQMRQSDENIILDVARCLKDNNGDVRKTREIMINKYDWITLGWIWHLKDKSVSSNITDKVFRKDEFPKCIPLTESDVLLIVQKLLEHKGDKFISETVRKELENSIPGLTREKVRCIKDKRAWADFTDRYFKKGEV